MKLNFKPIVITVLSLMVLLLTASVALARDYVVPDEPLDTQYEGEYKAGSLSFSTDGRYMAFAAMTDGEVYLLDRQTDDLIHVSVNGTGTPLEGSSTGMTSVSDDGRYVTFDRINNLSEYRVYVRDLQAGTTELVARNKGGQILPELNTAGGSITPDGRYIVYYGYGEDTPDGYTAKCNPISIWCAGVFVYDQVKDTTRRVSVNNQGKPANRDSGYSDISDNGRYILFISDSTNLGGPNKTCYGGERCWYYYIHDMVTRKMQMVPLPNNDPNADVIAELTIFGANISGNGRYVVYTDGVTTSDETEVQVYVYDALTRQTETIVMHNAQNEPINTANLGTRAISDDGRFVFILGDALGNWDWQPYVYDRATQTFGEIVDGLGAQVDIETERSILPRAFAISGDGSSLGYAIGDLDNVGDDDRMMVGEGEIIVTGATSVKLNKNGGGERQGNVATRAHLWKSNDIKTALRRCNTATLKIAHSGKCAFSLKAVNGKSGVLSYAIPPYALVGDTLTLSAWVKGTNLSGARVKAQIVYTDGTKEAILLDDAQLNAGTYGYTALTTSQTLEKLPRMITIQMTITSGTGKLLVDDVSLMMGSGEAETPDLVPLPEAPTLDGLPGRTSN